MASAPISTFPPARPAQGVSMEPEMLIPERAAVAYAAPGAFLAWLHRARPGQVCVYARATTLSRREAIGATVRLVADGGQVILYQSRPSALLPYLYFARRTVKPLTIAPKPAPLSDTQVRVLEHLTTLADAGEPHGSNSGIAMQLGLGSRDSVKVALAALERAGLIRRSQDAVFDRVIEIVETGRKTRGCR